MALIQYSDLAGGTAAFNSDNFIRMRPTHGGSEPENALTIRTDKKRFHAGSSLEDVVDHLVNAIDLIELTTPVGLSVWIAKARLIDVVEASPNLHHPNANSVLTLHEISEPTNGSPLDQQVRETVTEVMTKFNG